jgi:hypothetical protein
MLSFADASGAKALIFNKKAPHIEVTAAGGYDKDKIKIRIGGK